MSRTERYLFSPGQVINGYSVISLIGQGGYGDIYSVESDSTEQYAMKVESINSPKKGMCLEIEIMQKIQGHMHFPRLVCSGVTETHRFFVMELLGPSISNIRRSMYSKKFSLSTTLRLSIFMLKCLSQFHLCGMLHRDIKPGNFLFKKGSSFPLKIIDYGLSRVFIDPKTGEPYPQRSRSGFRGTSKYASLSAHRNMELSWKDDIISWLYSIVELIDGKLPWLTGQNMETTEDAKNRISPRSLFSSLPGEFIDIWRYINMINYHERPDYLYIEDLILRSIAKNSINALEPFDWEIPRNYRTKNSPYIDILPKSDEFAMFLNIPYSFHIAMDEYDRSRCGLCRI